MKKARADRTWGREGKVNDTNRTDNPVKKADGPLFQGTTWTPTQFQMFRHFHFRSCLIAMVTVIVSIIAWTRLKHSNPQKFMMINKIKHYKSTSKMDDLSTMDYKTVLILTRKTGLKAVWNRRPRMTKLNTGIGHGLGLNGHGPNSKRAKVWKNAFSLFFIEL